MLFHRDLVFNCASSFPAMGASLTRLAMEKWHSTGESKNRFVNFSPAEPLSLGQIITLDTNMAWKDCASLKRLKVLDRVAYQKEVLDEFQEKYLELSPRFVPGADLPPGHSFSYSKNVSVEASADVNVPIHHFLKGEVGLLYKYGKGREIHWNILQSSKAAYDSPQIAMQALADYIDKYNIEWQDDWCVVTKVVTSDFAFLVQTEHEETTAQLKVAAHVVSELVGGEVKFSVDVVEGVMKKYSAPPGQCWPIYELWTLKRNHKKHKPSSAAGMTKFPKRAPEESRLVPMAVEYSPPDSAPVKEADLFASVEELSSKSEVTATRSSPRSLGKRRGK